MPTKSPLYNKMQNAGFDVTCLTYVAAIVHGTRVTDREEALDNLLDYLGVLGPVTK